MLRTNRQTNKQTGPNVLPTPTDSVAVQSGRNFTYPEGYMDHADAYKSALTLNDIIDEASPNEQSWILQDIAQLPFVKTACETGFNAGHHAFHMLTANYDLVVHSFEVCLSA